MWLVLTACAPEQHYAYKAPATQHALPAAQAKVVAISEAMASGLASQPLQITFDGRDGTELVIELLKQADAANAAYVADLAVYVETTQDGKPVECRSEIVPETVTESTFRPAENRSVSVSRPVTRMVTEYEYRCHPVTATELRSVTEYEQQCATTSVPVQKSRTVYTSQYDSTTHMSRSEPRTEYYTDYESRYECKQVPVSKQRSETVTKQQCGAESVTHSVTRYEFQLESHFVPAHYELVTRQRLHELDPACYVLDGPDPAVHANRIEGKIFVRRP